MKGGGGIRKQPTKVIGPPLLVKEPVSVLQYPLLALLGCKSQMFSDLKLGVSNHSWKTAYDGCLHH